MTRSVRARLRSATSLDQTFAAFRYRNYRLWFVGQMVSLFGTWMQSTAQGFLVFELTHSPAYLGYVSFASGVPAWLLALYGGVIADRVPRRTLLVITQTCLMILAFILGLLTFTHQVRPWHIIVLAFALGLTNAFDAPGRQSFVLEMVEREDLSNAIALNSTMFNLATIVGPAAGGIVYALLGAAWCFTLNGISFIAVIVALLLMSVRPLAEPPSARSTRAELLEGLHYVAGHPSLRAIIGLAAAINLFGVSFAVLVPAWAVTVLHGGATTNGLLQSARGLGALACGLFIASLGRFRYKGRLLTLGTLVYPAALLLFALTRGLSLSLLALMAVGGTQVLVLNLANSLVQAQTADELRGRVMAIYSLSFLGFYPVGGLLFGAAAQRIGEPPTIAVGALITLACGVALRVFAPHVRRLP